MSVQALPNSEQQYHDYPSKELFSQVPSEPCRAIVGNARRSLADNAAELVSLTTTSEQQPQWSLWHGSLARTRTVLASAGTVLSDIVTEAALVSTCPDGFLGVPLPVGSTTAAASNSPRPSITQPDCDPGVSKFLSRFDQLSDHHPNLQPQESLVRLCNALGTHPSAANGWAAMSEKPRAALLIEIFSSAVVIILVGVLALGVDHSFLQPYVGIIQFLMIGSDTAMFCLIWRYGPMYGKTTLYLTLFFIWLTLASLLGCLMYVGPVEFVPYRSQLKTTLMLGGAVFASNVANKLGRLAFEHPTKPLPDFRVVFVDATIRSLRVVDSLTDMILVRLLATQVQHFPAVLTVLP
jgi:hypothetical protein